MKSLALIIFVALQLVSCANSKVSVEAIKGKTMGTTYSILWSSQSPSIPHELIQSEVDELLASLNSQMSTYDPDSELSVFNARPFPSSQKISAPFSEVVALSLVINEITDGYFDVTVGPLVNLWGFGPDKASINKPLDSKIKEALLNTGSNSITLDQGILSKGKHRYIDLSAIAKGYAVDAVAELLDRHNIHDYLVEIGGEMKAKGVKAPNLNWKIAIETPDLNERRVHKILAVSDISIATSGDYRNFFELDGKRYSHSIDPKTGRPVEHSLASVTILDESCARADALATAMLVMGMEKAKKFVEQNEVKAYLIVRDQKGEFEEYLSPAFAGWFNP
jgi:thiamine biosynthesis lipoprotein